MDREADMDKEVDMNREVDLDSREVAVLKKVIANANHLLALMMMTTTIIQEDLIVPNGKKWTLSLNAIHVKRVKHGLTLKVNCHFIVRFIFM